MSAFDRFRAGLARGWFSTCTAIATRSLRPAVTRTTTAARDSSSRHAFNTISSSAGKPSTMVSDAGSTERAAELRAQFQNASAPPSRELFAELCDLVELAATE